MPSGITVWHTASTRKNSRSSAGRASRGQAPPVSRASTKLKPMARRAGAPARPGAAVPRPTAPPHPLTVSTPPLATPVALPVLPSAWGAALLPPKAPPRPPLPGSPLPQAPCLLLLSSPLLSPLNAPPLSHEAAPPDKALLFLKVPTPALLLEAPAAGVSGSALPSRRAAARSISVTPVP